MAQTYPLPTPTRRVTLLKLIGWMVVGAALVVLLIAQARALILLAQNAQVALDHPYTLNYGEGPLLDQAVRLARGENIYSPDLSAPPYTITNYPPLYVLAQVPFVERFGAALWYGRLISLISTGAAGLFLALTMRAITKDWIAAVAAGLTLPAIPYIFYWSALARIDALALALSMAGLWLIAARHKRRWGLMGGALLLAAAAYTRQTYLLAAPLAAFVYVWALGERYRAMMFAVLFGCIVTGIFALLTVASEGGIFFHIVTANVNALNPDLIAHYWDEITRWLPILLAAGAVYLIVGAVVGRPAWWLIAPYSAGAIIVALTISKVGSDVNYLFEFSAALCLAAGGLIALVRRWFPLRALALLALAYGVTMATGLAADQYAPINGERARDPEKYDRLIETIRATDAPMLADEHMGLLVLNGKPILMQPFEMSQLSLVGVWDEQPFLDALARGDYPIVLLYQPYRNPELRFERWTPEMLRAINDYYRPEYQSAETTVYRYAGS